MADQTQPVRRRVALKVLKPGMDTGQVVARFEAERQALALMDHPNIAKILDGGTTASGRPYFVMELVKGVPLTRYCDEHRLTPRERLGLFIPVCEAVQHAHQKGIIHRDLKPSNVLVAQYDGKPVPKVIDFGVAKATGAALTERTLDTGFGGVVGTPEYMSPEQATFNNLDIDTRSDVYALGVLLYELLAGSPPFSRKELEQKGLLEMLRVVREQEPPRPSAKLSTADALPTLSANRGTEPKKLTGLLRNELDWIVMKCLEKDRTRRYETANGLARDLQRYLADEPVEAGPPSTTYRLRKLARKHRAALAVCGAFVLLLLAGTAMSTWQAVRATRAEQQMQAERDRAQMALTHQVAGRLDGDLRQLAKLGDLLVTFLALLPDFKDDQLESLLTDLLNKDNRIHGLTLAYEDKKGPKKDEHYCLYVYRDATKTPIRTDLLPPKYRYREWTWYQKPLKTKGAHWTGPSFDVDSKAWMVGYSVPIRRGGETKPVGVLCVDLELAYFNRVWDWLKELDLGKKSYGFVVNGNGSTAGQGLNTEGVFVSHFLYGAGAGADQSPKKITELDRDVLGRDVDPAFTALTRRILKGDTGRETAIDPATGKRSTFLFTPVPSTGWSFVAVVED
jgi:hypothetical protein